MIWGMTTPDHLPAIAVGTVGYAAGTAQPPPDPYRAYLARLDSESSKATMAKTLNALARIIIEMGLGHPLDPEVAATVTGAGCPWWTLRPERVMQIREILTDPARGWAPATVNRHLAALRGVLEECWHLGLMDTDEYLRAKSVRNVKGSRVRHGRTIHADELAKMLASADAPPPPASGTHGGTRRPAGWSPTTIRYRDTAMLTAMQSTGIRCAEVCAAQIECYDPRERGLRVIGKGNKERWVWIHKDAVPYWDRWLALVGERSGPVFRQVDKWGNIRPNGITTNVVYQRVNFHRVAAGLPPLSPHDFRRTFISSLYDNGGDDQKNKRLAGHASSTTTGLYDLRGNRGLRELTDRLPIVLPPTPALEAES